MADTPGLPIAYKPTEALHSNACHACIVELDRRTGLVRVVRYVVSEDCGVMINPGVVEGQIIGGVAQGIGGVLYGHAAYDDDGSPIASPTAVPNRQPMIARSFMPRAGSRHNVSSHHQSRPLLRHTEPSDRPAVELEKVRLDAVGKDDAVRRHLRTNYQLVAFA